MVSDQHDKPVCSTGAVYIPRQWSKETRTLSKCPPKMKAAVYGYRSLTHTHKHCHCLLILVRKLSFIDVFRERSHILPGPKILITFCTIRTGSNWLFPACFWFDVIKWRS